jgi:cytochrome c peroxidase
MTLVTGIRRALLCGVAALAGTSAHAAELTIGQKDSQFSKGAVSLKAGDSITFTNDDNIYHNISVKGPSGSKTSPMQKPGDSTSVKFDSQGPHQVSCVIHPKMKLEVDVR